MYICIYIYIFINDFKYFSQVKNVLSKLPPFSLPCLLLLLLLLLLPNDRSLLSTFINCRYFFRPFHLFLSRRRTNTEPRLLRPRFRSDVGGRARKTDDISFEDPPLHNPLLLLLHVCFISRSRRESRSSSAAAEMRCSFDTEASGFLSVPLKFLSSSSRKSRCLPSSISSG